MEDKCRTWLLWVAIRIYLPGVKRLIIGKFHIISEREYLQTAISRSC